MANKSFGTFVGQAIRKVKVAVTTAGVKGKEIFANAKESATTFIADVRNELKDSDS